MKTKKLSLGILAHVDAGKTTLVEGLLYETKQIRELGRVDKKNAFLDTDAIERERGITIFSKQALLPMKDVEFTLLDTPGHVDFSAEMERTLSVMDYAILVISCRDGIQSHTETLWKLLDRYQIPVFVFVNKMDQAGNENSTERKEMQEKVQEELSRRLSDGCVSFSDQWDEDFYEQIAMCGEDAMEEFLEEGIIREETIRNLISERKLFPVYYGSALKTEGILPLIDGLGTYTDGELYLPYVNDAFSARVFKITRDTKGERLTHLKVTGGTLKVKDLLSGYQLTEGSNPERWEEKVNQLRIYSGSSFLSVQEAPAGTVCAVTGLTKTYAGQGLGEEKEDETPLLEPVLTYRIELPSDEDPVKMLGNLRILEEEIPELHLVWNEKNKEILAQVMGDIQIQILKTKIKERFGVVVEFGTGRIVYKETLAENIEGVGHFEPLRHYAEVHLRLEPGERGSGIVIDTECSEDVLDRNWQRLIFTHLLERKHPGVLGGFELTDVKIVLTAGRAHLKHTEGGDFRQATYRAVRQGLKKGVCHLLEPMYAFRLEVPSANVGRALNDIQKMAGSFAPPEPEGDFTIISGNAPVSTMRNYQKEVAAYTGGRGRFSAYLSGYELCHNEAEVLAELTYDSELDFENPTGSVFCAHGAGFNVPWYEVEDYMHLEATYGELKEEEEEASLPMNARRKGYVVSSEEEAKELEEIFERTFRKSERKRAGYERKRGPVRSVMDTPVRYRKAPVKPKEQYLLVDGYNIIFGWEDLKELAAINIESARAALLDVLCNYQGYKRCTLIVVFDAYKVKGNPGSVQKFHNIHVVYTKEAETADMYIEKTVHDLSKNYQVTVATSDGLEQLIIMGQGASRLSAREFRAEVEQANKDLQDTWLNKGGSLKNYLLKN